MRRKVRIIPSLLIDENGGLVKTKKFSKPRYLGDPVNTVKIFNRKYVDELTILDISASKLNKGPNFDLLKDIASEAFMPLSYGGGITNLEQAKKLFSIGYEKVILNTSLVEKPQLISQIVDYAGSQSVVASIDYKTSLFSKKKKCVIEDGSKELEMTPVALAKQATSLGVGEILLNSINNDGMMSGYDINTIKEVVDYVSVPVIACGGAGSFSDLKEAIMIGKAHAVAAGSLFVFYGREKAVLITYPEEELYLN